MGVDNETQTKEPYIVRVGVTIAGRKVGGRAGRGTPVEEGSAVHNARTNRLLRVLLEPHPLPSFPG